MTSRSIRFIVATPTPIFVISISRLIYNYTFYIQVYIRTLSLFFNIYDFFALSINLKRNYNKQRKRLGFRTPNDAIFGKQEIALTT